MSHSNYQTKEVITTNGTTTGAQAHSIRPELVPDHIRDDFCNHLLKGFLKAIEDPENLRRYRELGQAFLDRMAAKAGSQ